MAIVTPNVDSCCDVGLRICRQGNVSNRPGSGRGGGCLAEIDVMVIPAVAVVVAGIVVTDIAPHVVAVD